MNSKKHSCVPAIKPAARARYSRYLGLLAIACSLFIQPACLFRKHGSKATVPQAPPAAVRIALMPFNIPAENSDLRWLSLAAPLVMAKTIENSPAFEVVPLWQTYPVAIESLGASRTITPEVAAYVASRVGAKWAASGELTPAKNGIWMRVDFIPVKATMVPYRFEKEGGVDALGANSHEAFSQFSRYLVLQPMAKADGKGSSTSAMRQLAEASDREYGWYTTAEPGKSDRIAADLVRSDSQFARMLFDPILYPGIASVAGKPKSVDLKPAAAENIERPDTRMPPPAPPAQPPATETQAPPPVRPIPPPVAQTPPVPATTEPAEAQQAAVIPSPSAPPPPSGQSASTQVTLRKATPANPPSLKSGLPATASKPADTSAAKTVEMPDQLNKKVVAPAEGRRFQIQVYSTQQKEGADAKAAGLAREGYVPRIETVELPGKGTWYRIRLVGFKSPEDAKAAGEKLVASKLISQYWIVP